MITPEEFLGNMQFPNLAFGEQFISDYYRAFVNTLPCSYPKCENTPCDAHHTIHKSAGKSAGDELTIPLCRSHHSKWISVDRFEHETGLKIADVIRSVWQRFIRKVEEIVSAEHPERRKPKVNQKSTRKQSKDNLIFKPIKNSKMQRCKRCLFKSEPTDEMRHFEHCSEYIQK